MITCKICGNIEDDDKFVKEVKNDLLKNNICFKCYHWNRQLELNLNTNRDYAIIDGQHYVIGPEHDDGGFRGFGGRKFIIEFNDGRIVETTNLWHQGTIPDGYWREKMQDNAKFN